MAKTTAGKHSKASNENQEVESGEQNVISLLQECHNACHMMFMEYAASESGQDLSFSHIKRLQACIDICDAAASYLLKDGIMAYRLCEIAARLCEECAEACEQVEDEEFQQCAQLCLNTAEACLEESHRLRRLETRNRRNPPEKPQARKAEFALVKGDESKAEGKSEDKNPDAESGEERGAKRP